MARTAKPLLDKLKDQILQLSVPELEILSGYTQAVLDVREADAAKKSPNDHLGATPEEPKVEYGVR